MPRQRWDQRLADAQPHPQLTPSATSSAEPKPRRAAARVARLVGRCVVATLAPALRAASRALVMKFLFFFKQKTSYAMPKCLEFRRGVLRSASLSAELAAAMTSAPASLAIITAA